MNNVLAQDVCYSGIYLKMIFVLLQDKSVKDAVLCLKAQQVDDLYSIALMTYAMSLVDPSAPFRAQLMDKLDRKAVFRGELTNFSENYVRSFVIHVKYFYCLLGKCMLLHCWSQGTIILWPGFNEESREVSTNSGSKIHQFVIIMLLICS